MTQYRIKADYHTHTVFSHGKGTIEDNVQAARRLGIKELGISDHGPGHVFYGINRSDIPRMREEIDRLNALYDDICIKLSVEANIINKNGIMDVPPNEFALFDYVIAGYHYGVIGAGKLKTTINHGQNIAENHLKLRTAGLTRYNTEVAVNTILKNKIKILTHPGDKAPVDLRAIAEACAESDTLLELNSWHNSMTADDIRAISDLDVSFVVSSDAHDPSRVGDIGDTVKIALDAGLDIGRIINIEMCG